ncbi:MAG: thioredoxin domain-containing protein [Anaeromyxobacter sp.]|nr:thioredoxin domain-containing protein [Anaeromyxobacter sp.]MBL0275076.1 thioredoxin domain-containing protein [Anaeromyxobacter sp.]
MRTRPLFLGALAVAVVACQSPRPTQAASADAGVTGKNAPVARIGAEVITADEVDKLIRNELNEVEQKTYDLRKQALDQLITQRLVDAKAKAAGLKVPEFLEKELATKVAAPSDEEIRAIYERAKAAKQVEEPLDKVKPQIAQFLKQQKGQVVLAQYVEQLRAEAKVEVLLPAYLPPKVEVSSTGPSKGPDDAPVTIVEFSDFQCPYCARAESTVKDLMELEKYKGKIKLVYRDYPLPSHNLAPKASEAAHCAGDQGKYWDMHGKLFAVTPRLEVTDLKAYARELKLDEGRFDKCLDSGEKAAVVAEHAAAGEKAGVRGTPAFFINGRLLSGAQPLEAFKPLIDAELAAKK